MSFTSIAQIDRSKMPEPGPAPKVKLGESKKFILKNGLTVIMVENHKLPRASVNLTIDNYPSFEGDKAGVSSMMGSLLGRGTTNISKDEFNERVDYLGAYLSFSSGGAYGASLKKYFPEILELMADGVKNSQFTQEEFEKEKKITLDGIKSNEKSVTSAARRVEDALTYGKEHPFGEFITKETVKNITLKDVENRYKNYYKPNNAYLIIIGDINPKKIKKMVKKLFSDWKSGSIPEYTMPKVNNVETTEIDFINMDNAVQSEIAVVNSLDLTLGDKDYYAALLANQILGGGGTARLFQNLREDKAYTYGSYSRVRQSRYVGTFKATASVRNMVTDSSVVEIQKEINKIRYQKVSEQELRDAKELYIGNFVMEVQKPATAARYALNRELYNLPEDYYETYLEKINAVTINDVQDAAIKYFKGDKARIIITGKGIDVLKNLEKNSDYKINYFDKFGNPSEKPEMTLPIPEGVTAASVIDSYFNAIGGADKIAAIKTLAMTYNATIQGTPVVLTTKVAAPNKTTNTISVMGQTMQKQAFNGENGYNEMRGQKKEFDEKEINKSKSNTAPFSDMAYKNGLLDRIEPIDGKNAYVIKSGTTEIYYDVATGLKLQSVEVLKTPDGKETKVPTIFSDYKEVGGVLFAHKRDQVTPQFTLNFVLQDVKINEGVEDKDFE
jgi:predicted Zn-dependent peptidase